MAVKYAPRKTYRMLNKSLWNDNPSLDSRAKLVDGSVVLINAQVGDGTKSWYAINSRPNQTRWIGAESIEKWL